MVGEEDEKMQMLEGGQRWGRETQESGYLNILGRPNARPRFSTPHLTTIPSGEASGPVKGRIQASLNSTH